MNKNNNNYIYTHKRNDTGEVFYIGRGTGLRMFKNSSRSVEWKDIVNSVGFTAEIYKDNLSFEEAHDLEVFLISNPLKDWKLINKSIPSIVNYDKDLLSQYFKIDSTSPSGLSHVRNSRKTKVNQKAGTLSQDGYWLVRVNGISYRVSRVIVALAGVIIPAGHVVNHIDGNPLNNKIENLEVVTQLENNGICKLKVNKIRKDNTTGIPGISHCVSKKKYITSITIDGKRIRKIFRYTEDTKSDTLKEAASYLSALKDSILNNQQ